MFEPNDDYRRALDVLTIQEIWASAFADGAVRVAPPQRAGLSDSPFRDDGSNGSFSIVGDGRGFKDHGGDGVKGGLKKFAELCWPQSTAGEMADRLIELSGITRTPAFTKPVAGKPGEAAPVDPAIARAAKSIAKRNRLQELENKIYEERQKKLRPPSQRWSPEWPEVVRDRYLEGRDYLSSKMPAMNSIAKDRGWPVAWVEALVEMELIAMPWERMATPGAKWAKRQKAFVVQQPKIAGSAVTLTPVGYHQRFFEPPKNERAAIKGWLYLPSLPKFAARSEYERELVDYGKSLGIAEGERQALVPPAPFVLGDLVNPRLIVLLEGQWDAITFFGACGWFHDTAIPEGVAVFGIRGVQGMDAFLGLWHRWLDRHKPRAWLLADNDAAGGTWRDAPPAEPGLPAMPSIGERLEAAGCVAPVVSWLKGGAWGKDFNDYFKHCGGAAKLTPAIMHKWMHGLGLFEQRKGRAA